MENLILQSVEELQKSKLPLCLWGCGRTARRLTHFYKSNGIDVFCYLQSKKFFKPNTIFNGIKVECLEDFLDNLNHDINFVVAHASLSLNELNNIDNSHIHKFYLMDVSSAFVIENNELNIYDEAFWNKNKLKFNELRENLFDEVSKESLDSWIYQKRTSVYYQPHSKNTQYFDKDIINFSPNEVYVDCGAYTGDTVKSFIECSKHKTRQLKIYAIEPDKSNFDILNATINHQPSTIDIVLLDKLLWNKREFLKFSFLDSNSSITQETNIHDSVNYKLIETETLDYILGSEKATFIKMDLEGAEYPTLQGGYHQLITNKPKLAICIYHKKDDIINIYEYIKKLNMDYKFYFRRYFSNAIEGVLYAV